MVRWHAFAHNGVHTGVYGLWCYVEFHVAAFGVALLLWRYKDLLLLRSVLSGSILFGLPILYIVGASFLGLSGRVGRMVRFGAVVVAAAHTTLEQQISLFSVRMKVLAALR